MSKQKELFLLIGNFFDVTGVELAEDKMQL